MTQVRRTLQRRKENFKPTKLEKAPLPNWEIRFRRTFSSVHTFESFSISKSFTSINSQDIPQDENVTLNFIFFYTFNPHKTPRRYIITKKNGHLYSEICNRIWFQAAIRIQC